MAAQVSVCRTSVCGAFVVSDAAGPQLMVRRCRRDWRCEFPRPWQESEEKAVT